MDAGRDDAENTEIRTVRDMDGGELRIGGNEPDGAVPSAVELLDREVAVQNGDDDGAIPRREAFIDDQNVPRLDSRARHGVP